MNKTAKNLTSNELKAVREISAIFTKQINETGDITSIFNELFISDFVERYIKEKKREIAQNIKLYRPEVFNPKRITFVFNLYYDANLLDKATANDWKRLYIATFNYNHFETVTMLNKTAKIFARKEVPDLEKLVLGIENNYPVDVIKLFDNHPNLKGFIRKKQMSEPIETVEELRSVLETLEQGLKLLNEGKNGMPSIELSEDTPKLEAKYNSRPYFGVQIEISDDEFWGFPKRTRFVSFWMPPGRKIFMIKANGKYKIILKPFP